MKMVIYARTWNEHRQLGTICSPLLPYFLLRNEGGGESDEIEQPIRCPRWLPSLSGYPAAPVSSQPLVRVDHPDGLQIKKKLSGLEGGECATLRLCDFAQLQCPMEVVLSRDVGQDVWTKRCGSECELYRPLEGRYFHVACPRSSLSGPTS